jgi:NAD(P)H-dependent flavin oxidoreductase YrpB (nitropropane dioxygenase family)
VSLALRTRLCELLGIELPIIQTGMGWVSGAQLTAATSEAGGLGILGSATMTMEQLTQAIDRVQARTRKPFGVNLRTDQDDIGARVELLIARKIKVASFAQAPSREIIQKLKAAGIFTMPTIGARRHAEKMAEWGVDAVIAQGQEGGGHTGGVPTSLLLPQVVDAVSIPVVAAGGYFDGRGLVAALAYGAAGIAMGTRFLLTRESQVPEAIKAKYLAASVTDTVVTKAIDGYPQRVIATAIVRALDGQSPVRRWLAALVHAWRFSRLTQTSFLALVREGLALRARQELSYSQLLMAANAPMLTRASMVEGRIDSGVLPTGQVVGVIDTLPSVDALLQQIVREAEDALARLIPRDVVRRVADQDRAARDAEEVAHERRAGVV